MKNKINIFRKTTVLLLSLVTSSFIISCEDAFRDDLPDANSVVDTVLPTADFSYAAYQLDFRAINFTDLSSEASSYSWDFGVGVVCDTTTVDGEHGVVVCDPAAISTSTNRDVSFVTFAGGEGTYPVTLTSSDANNETSTITLDVIVVDELVPVFECPSFECSPRTPWAGNGGETSTFTGSSGPTPPDGSTGAKISSSSQWLDQTILVSPDTSYVITFWYVSTPGSTNGGSLLIQDADSGQNFKNEDLPASPTSGQYYEISYSFTTAAETENLRFRMDYGGFECRYDLISIDR